VFHQCFDSLVGNPLVEEASSGSGIGSRSSSGTTSAHRSDLTPGRTSGDRERDSWPAMVDQAGRRCGGACPRSQPRCTSTKDAP